ncbi:hypothetical protein Pla108_42100 [Botrimarina colliarenosi]|uniref:Uncharacterized protein n=1 Tax=Botrimarina colliarenosi TaxID=2528001 RepID=A0A5C5ZXL4_9BACT|nr:BNR-4 repeat-containing protein [Botrimarina colliarenosi]TWT91727.1 hypothetical protein Pla108_42100 [Botrimarina colliarenosi]
MYVTSGVGLSPVDPTSANTGSQFLTANRLAPNPDASFPSSQQMNIFQTIDLSSYSSEIDTGSNYVELNFSYNAADAGDGGFVSMDFFDAAASPLGTGLVFSTESQPTSSGMWSSASLFGAAPAGAKSVRFTLASERISGSGSARNVSFDSLSAQLLDSLPPTPPKDVVHGNLVQFANNGAWSWFQDERAIVDAQRGQLIVGSIANRDGYGGESVDGHVQTTHFNLSTGVRTRYTHNDLESYGAGDDHNVPALLKKSDGDILAVYAAHNRLDGVEDDRSYYRTYDAEAQAWGAESEYHWWDVIPSNAPGNGGTTYSNVFQLSAEDPDGDGVGRLYNIARTNQSPHIMYSDDNGGTWQYGGQLTKQASGPPSSSYVNGYYKYVSNGVDRIDLIATEFHPRDYNNSLYHAYIQNGKLYNSDGVVIDDNLFDAAESFDPGNVSSTDDFTQVFQSGTSSNSRVWNTDVQTYEDGSISVLFKARAGGFGSHSSGAGDHRVWFARFDPQTTEWTTTEIAKAGGQLFPGNETDYTGLGALHPQDPNTIYLSTEIDPTTDEQLAHHEIYRGETADAGQTWTWTAVTENSSYDNLRPIIPSWDENSTAVLWWRGSMDNSHDYDTAVVGVIDRNQEQLGEVRFIDATIDNTTLANGAPANFGAPSAQPGTIDNAWGRRTGVGNGEGVFTADDSGGEEAPRLKTTITDLESGEYEVFAFFWSDGNQDWQIEAGFDAEHMELYRTRGAQQAEAEQFEIAPVLDEGLRSLYRAYVGRAQVDEGGSIEVLIDDSTGGAFQSAWYDGLGIAAVQPTASLAGDFNHDGVVDAADYTVWRDGNSPDSSQTGYDIWSSNYRRTAAAPTLSAEVPEPSACLLLLRVAILIVLRRPLL